MKSRNVVSMALRVTAPNGMPPDAVRREVLTRINDLTGCYSAFDLRLSDRAEGPDGNLRVRAAEARPAAPQTPGLLAALHPLVNAARAGIHSGPVFLAAVEAAERAIRAAEGREG